MRWDAGRRIACDGRKALTLSTLTIPTAEQLAATRASLWHQNGQPLLTLESLRAWVNDAGLVLYARRPQQLPAPMPTLVEAVLGTPNAEPGLAEVEQARSLMARLVAEGSAVPLNLMGTTTDVPDFICSAAVFSYLFTLRGDKAWKQPPATLGAVKVSPLGLATYEAIARRVTLTAAELATELGKEVTEAAVLRGLVELWAQLRVLPVPQQDGTAMWELTSTRLTKQIKAGANAGQPTALSALISLYLGMTVVATEDEIETMLSPVAPRSRIRDVVHALLGARQLETIAIDGRTVVYLAGALPAFAGVGMPEESAAASATVETIAAEGRISKFVPKAKKVGTGYAKKFTARPEADRERRPFQKKPFEGASKPSFTRPWEEKRPAAAGTGEASDRPRKASFDRPKRAESGGKPAFGAKPRFGDRQGSDGGTRPTFRRDEGRGPGERRSGGDLRGKERGADERPRREYTPRGSSAGNSREGGKTFERKPNFGGKPAFGARAAFGQRDEGSGRPEAGSTRPPRREFPGGARPGGERRPGSYAARPQGEGFGVGGRKPPFAGRTAGPTRPSADAGLEAPRRVFRKFDAPRFDKPRSDRPGSGKESSDRPKRPFNPDGPVRPAFSGGGKRYSGKPGASAGKKPFAGMGSKPPGTFAKFADGAQPFRRPFAGKPAGKSPAKSGGGPTFRKRKPAEGETA